MMDPALQQALQLHQGGRLAEAEAIYARLLAGQPGFYPALHLFGLLRLQQGRLDQALVLTERALKVEPNAAATLSNYGIVLEGLGRFAEALAAFTKAIAAAPNQSSVWANRGSIQTKLGRTGMALDDFDRAIALDPRNVDAHHNRGVTLQTLGRLDEALKSYSSAIALAPNHIAARNNRGVVLTRLNRDAEALGDFDAIITARAATAGTWVNRAAALWHLGRIDEAQADYDKALTLDPDNVEALTSRGEMVWARRKTLAPAIADLERAYALAPQTDYLLGDLFHMHMYGGDWRSFATDRAALDAGVAAGRAMANPFVYCGIAESPDLLLSCVRDYTARKFPPQTPLRSGVGRRPGKIRIGYLCGEFRAQATAYLTAGLFEAHDRERFEIVAIDNTQDDDSAMRRRLLSAFGGGRIDISNESDAQAAAKIAAADIDILVNLNGYFGRMRMGVCARRPAPLQVNYLGFPSSLGASYMDYILADGVVIPDGEDAFYAEKVVRLPHSYQINDNKREIGLLRPRRVDLGLPQDGIVFCHFNYSYKIAPPTFSSWMRILQAVEGSVLWLLDSDPLFTANMRREAAARGVDPSRLVFAPQVPVDEHLARLASADLFLDSLPYNAHTTASDALWAGLPLLTCRGTAFAGRVAASLLQAVGLNELITENADDFEAMAIRLARAPALLGSLRARLAEARATAPLFDTVRTTRAIERAFQTMFDTWQAGKKSQGFTVGE